MASDTPVADAPKGKAAVPVVDNFDLTLDEFCRRQSSKKVGPELIGGFFHAQTVVGNLKNSEAAYLAAFDVFANQPA